MKINNTTTILTISFVLLFACAVKKEVMYTLPEAMLPQVKEEYAKRCDKGQLLYNLNCAGCHNYKVKRKTYIPDFKPEQLRGYELRISNARHANSMPDSLVSEEELGIIMTFLSYKNKNKLDSIKK